MAGSLRTVRWLVVGTALALVAVLAGFVGYAHYRATSFLNQLPGKLGIDIQQESDNFTYSQSLGGKTVFTVHAGKEITHRNGLITLRDVAIVLYGRSGDREDRVRGQEFEFDQKNGILRAVGEAMIDLGPPGAGKTDEEKMIHVKTSGLVFRQKEGTAETTEGVAFTANGMTGEARGARYDSKTRVLVLESAVKVSGIRGNRPVLLTAAHAEMDRLGNVVRLDGPRYISAVATGSETVAAEHAVVHTDDDGKPKTIEAEGRVELAGDGRGRVSSEQMEVALNDAGQPTAGHLWGGVKFGNDGPAKQETGRAQDLRVGFDGAGRPTRLLMNGAVELDEKAGASTRRLNAGTVDLLLSGGGKQRTVLRGAVASGGDGARLRVVDGKPGAGSESTGVRADRLVGRFGAAGLTGLDGTGRTLVERVSFDARGGQVAKETSTGDVLGLDLKEAAKGRTTLERATQRGNVEIAREAAAKKPGAPAEVEHARAGEGVYDAATDRLTLRGEAQVVDASGSVFGDTIELDRGTGDAVATGNVRGSYAGSKPGAEPAHVIAAKAVARKATGVTEFTAAPGGRVRMWQGGSQVEAAVIDLDKNRRTMAARGAGDADLVRAVVPQDARPGKESGPVRIVSQTLRYGEAERQIDFRGRVVVTSADGLLKAQEATVFLAPAAAPAGAGQGLFGGKVERVMAEGGVELDEPGRRATGERLLYTVAEETYVLTGTKALPPRLTDEARGTVTGAQIRFRRGEESVEVSGGEGGRVRSEPRMNSESNKKDVGAKH